MKKKIYSNKKYWKNINYENDKDTISKKWNIISAYYHYKFMELSILKYINYKPQTVLEIGAGYGHWIKFYKELYNCEITAIDTSVNIVKDIAKDNICEINNVGITQYCEGKYDIINAIGVLHHILGKDKFEQAIKNISEMATDLIFIGTRFDINKKERYRKFRDLNYWIKILKSNNINIIGIERSNPPYNIRKHLDLIVCKKGDR